MRRPQGMQQRAQGGDTTLNSVLNIAAFMPAFTHTQQQGEAGTAYVLRGRNFDWDLRGPKSGYGNVRLNSTAIPQVKLLHQPEIFRMQEQTLLFTAGTVYALDAVCGAPRVVFEFPWQACGDPCNAYHRWSQAYVGQVYMWSHPYAGIIFYDEHLGVWGVHPLASECFSGCVYGICASQNRLIVLSRDTVIHSVIDKPFELLCATGASSGMQSLDEISKGIPYGVYKTRGGFVAYTSRGILSGIALQETRQDWQNTAHPGQRTNAGLLLARPAFNYDWEADNIVALHSNAIADLGFRQLVLTKRGFYIIDGTRKHGEGVEPWQPLFGSYIAEDEFRSCGTLGLCAGVKLTYDEQFGKLYVSFRRADTAPYTRALVHQFDLDKWGSFDLPHRVLGAMHMGLTPYMRKKSFGFVDNDGWVAEFAEVRHSMIADGEGGQEVAGGCGLHYSLNAFIEVGPFRRTDYRYADRMTNFANVVLDMSVANGGSGDTALHSSRLVDAWEEKACSEVQTRCHTSIRCTIDAERLFETNEEPLHLVDVDGKRRHYACHNTGVAATILLRASLVGDYFHLHTVHVTGHIGGRY